MALILTLAAIITLPGSGSARTWDACSRAAEAAAKAADIPREWMHAIALAESGRGSGRDRTAWPWTVNDQGKGIWFDRKGDAVRHVEQRLAAGREMIDVGCFQINWRWHGQAFPSVEAAFDPQQNARYAAKFLRELFAATVYRSTIMRHRTGLKRRFGCSVFGRVGCLQAGGGRGVRSAIVRYRCAGIPAAPAVAPRRCRTI
jgi:hypothetical protein